MARFLPTMLPKARPVWVPAFQIEYELRVRPSIQRDRQLTVMSSFRTKEFCAISLPVMLPLPGKTVRTPGGTMAIESFPEHEQ